jgi:hypothetical protein
MFGARRAAGGGAGVTTPLLLRPGYQQQQQQQQQRHHRGDDRSAFSSSSSSRFVHRGPPEEVGSGVRWAIVLSFIGLAVALLALSTSSPLRSSSSSRLALRTLGPADEAPMSFLAAGLRLQRSSSSSSSLNHLVGGTDKNTCDDTIKPDEAPVLLGVDVAAYFSLYNASSAAGDFRPVMGSDMYTADYLGYTFWFGSLESRQLFESDPAKYTPRYGGFCSYGLAMEDIPSAKIRAAVNPQLYYISDDGRLFLFGGASVMDQFLQDFENMSRLADTHYSRYLGEQDSWADKSVFNNYCIKIEGV